MRATTQACSTNRQTCLQVLGLAWKLALRDLSGRKEHQLRTGTSQTSTGPWVTRDRANPSISMSDTRAPIIFHVTAFRASESYGPAAAPARADSFLAFLLFSAGDILSRPPP